MKIFFPFQKIVNPYLEELTELSHHTFTFGDLKSYDESFNIVNIHWPEALFDWFEPNDSQINELRAIIEIWKKKSILVYTLHDERRHLGVTPGFKELFRLIETNAEVFIHLGKFSKIKYSAKYPESRHEVVHHPLYKKSFQVYPKKIARDVLKINPNALVIIVPGTIRDLQERKMVLGAFNQLNHSEKVLIVTNMKSEINIRFPGRIYLKKLFDIKKAIENSFKKRHRPPKFLFHYGIDAAENISLKMSACDIVFIPRHNTLNSGNIFLGHTFEKIVVGPGIGNLKEHLEEVNFPIFDPMDKNTIDKAVMEGVRLYYSGFWVDQKLIAKHEPCAVAKVLDDLFTTLGKSKREG